MKLFSRIPAFIRNRYFLTSLAFAVWLAFFDTHNFISQYRWRSELNKLEADKSYYQEEIQRNKADLDALMSSEENLERFAREKYLMKADDEELFVIVPE